MFWRREIVVSVSLGVAVAIVAAFFPARRASFVDPASVMRKKNDGDSTSKSLTTSLTAGGLTLLLALIMAVVAHIRQNVMLGYAVGGVCAFAAAFFSPALSLLVGNVARRLFGRSDPAVMLGSVSFVRNAGRNSIAIAALGMSLANAVNADAFVGSMKHNTQEWFERSARADLFVFAGQNVKYKVDSPLPESIGDEIAKIPGVEFVDAGRTRQHTFRGKSFHLTAGVLERSRQYNHMPVVAGDVEQALVAIQAGTGIAASENFANNFHVKLGDRITLQTPSGDRTFDIAMVYVDFSSELGTLLTTRSVYKRIWQDTLVDAFYVYVGKGVDTSETRDKILATLGKRYRLLALSNGQYKDELMSLIDGSFTLSRATEIVAIIVAILGIINTLLVTVMDRRTEIGVLQAIGARRRQVQHMLMTEGALIGFAASLLGVLFGSVFSFYVVKELLRFQVGWQMSWQLSGWVLVETFVVSQIVAFISVWWPMRSAGKVDAIEALQHE
jgi:putative ABC transport system permease protein